MENKMQALLDYLWGLDIRDLEIVQQVADAFYSLKDYPRAEILYRKVFNRTKNIDTENKLTEVLVWQKKYDEALPVLEDLVNKKPRDLNLLKFFADVCAWAKKYDKAIGLYKRLLSYSQDKEEIVLRLADLLRFSGKNEEAIRLYNQYLKEKK
jgi:tetratricopeptide (TPR) repeat protein